jgi:hypothetical protein
VDITVALAPARRVSSRHCGIVASLGPGTMGFPLS